MVAYTSEMDFFTLPGRQNPGALFDETIRKYQSIVTCNILFESKSSDSAA
jgi:hypothetical protein